MSKKLLRARFRPRLVLVGLVALATLGEVTSPDDVLAQAKFTFEKHDDGLSVKRGDKLVTRYVLKSAAKPILWPLLGPHGEEMTRGYPMRAALPSEKSDHVHHRSVWLTHGDVNGVSFWHEQGGHGEIVHREFTKQIEGETAVLAAKCDWVGPGGVVHLHELREMTFAQADEHTLIDFDFALAAPKDRACVFGDTKEGSFGVRVAGTMKVDAKLGGKIENSEGLVDGAAWGKPAAWVDYHGPVDGRTVGLAILNHPSSFRFPTPWHVRTYGLFAANPFGLRDFGKDKTVNGAHTLAAGDSLVLRYRLVIHKGDTKSANIAAAYDAYAKTKKGE